MRRVSSFRAQSSYTHERASCTGNSGLSYGQSGPDSDNRVYYRGLRVYL